MFTFPNSVKATVVLATLLLLQNMGAVAAARVEMFKLLDTETSNGKRTQFECPTQCLECCDYSGLFGKSFKCILRNPKEVPQEAGRKCTTPKKRGFKYGVRSGSPAAQQHKTVCKYIDSEQPSQEKRCSYKYQCCCTVESELLGPKSFNQPPWTEERCFQGQHDVRQELANHNGKMELFKMVFPVSSSDANAQEIVNDKSSCQHQGNTHQIWDYDDRIVQWSESRWPFKNHYRHSLPSSEKAPAETTQRLDGCCLRIRTGTVQHSWTERHATPPGASLDDLLRGHVDRQYAGKKTYTMCDEFEKIHACSDDGGRTANGKLLYKNAGVQGTCLGDQQSTFIGEASQKLTWKIGDIGVGRNAYDQYCPVPTHGGAWCTCDPKQGCDSKVS